MLNVTLTEYNDGVHNFEWMFMDIQRDTPSERIRDVIINKLDVDIDVETLERNYTISGNMIIQDLIECHQLERKYDYRFDPDVKYTLEEYDNLINDYYNKSWDIVYKYDIDENGHMTNYQPVIENGKVKMIHNDNWDIVRAILNDYEKEANHIIKINKHNKLLLTDLTNMEQVYELLHDEIDTIICRYEQNNINKLFMNISDIIRLMLPQNEHNNEELINKILSNIDKSKETINIMDYIKQYYTYVCNLCFKRINQLKLGGLDAPKTIYSIIINIFNEPITYSYNMIDKFIDNYINKASKLKPLCRSELTQSYIKVQLSHLLKNCKNTLTDNIINDLRTYNFKYFNDFDNNYGAILCFAGGNNVIPRQIEVVEVPTNTTTNNINISGFIETLPDEIELNEFVNRYNEYFGTNETAATLPHKPYIRNNFEKIRRRQNGPKRTIYRKRAS